jgi:HlyD family secretion protein
VKKKRFWIIGGGGLLLVIFIVGGLLRPEKGKSVQASEVARQNLVALVKAPGTVQPRVEVEISGEVPGKIVEMPVMEGQAVSRGDLLVRLDDTAYRAEVAQAEAQLSSARSRLRSAETAWKAAQPQWTRRQKLYEDNLISVGELENAENEYESARSTYQTAERDVERFGAALTSAQDRLNKTVYRSPIDGVVIERNVEVGEIVVIGTMNNPGTVILSVGNLGEMVVEAEVDETDVIDCRIGQTASIEVDAFPDTSFHGEVIEIGRSPMRTSTAGAGEKNYLVKVLFETAPEQLYPGMTADVEIETAKRDSALSVPIQSVVLRSARDLEPKKKGRRRSRANPDSTETDLSRDLTGVFVVNGDRVQFREVQTGIAGSTNIEVIGAIDVGEKIVTGPYNVLRDLRREDKVKVTEETGRRR